MKKFKSFITSGALITAITLSLMSPMSSTMVNAATKKKTALSNKKITLDVGKKKTIKLKNYTKISKKKIKKVKWTSSNKKVATVKASGTYKQNAKITAKKAGNTTIKLKYNGKTYKCKVTVADTSSISKIPSASDIDTPTDPTLVIPDTPSTTEQTTTEHVTTVAHEHEWCKWYNVSIPTCQSEGKNARKCACGEIEYKSIPICDCSYHETITKEVTDTEDGLAHYECCWCGNSYDKVISHECGWSINTDAGKISIMATKSSNNSKGYYDITVTAENENCVINPGDFLQNAPDYVTKIASVTFTNKLKAGKDCTKLFHHVEEIKGLKYLDTSETEIMNYMFCAAKVTSLDLSGFDTSNVTDMFGMFAGCKSLISLDCSSFDTSKVTDMRRMFAECKNVQYINVSSFNTSNVTNMWQMFYMDYALTTLDITGFDTSNVTDMSQMFMACHKLTRLDLTNFDTHKVTTCSRMFKTCKALISVIVSNKWNIIVDNQFQMFEDAGCSNVTVK